MKGSDERLPLKMLRKLQLTGQTGIVLVALSFTGGETEGLHEEPGRHGGRKIGKSKDEEGKGHFQLPRLWAAEEDSSFDYWRGRGSRCCSRDTQVLGATQPARAKGPDQRKWVCQAQVSNSGLAQWSRKLMHCDFPLRLVMLFPHE